MSEREVRGNWIVAVVELARRLGRLSMLSVLLSVGMVIGVSIVQFSQRESGPQLEIIASLTPRQVDQVLSGRVLLRGVPQANVRVWGVLSDGKGNRASPNAAITNSEGGFTIESVPKTLGDNTVTLATIHALMPDRGLPWRLLTEPLKGEQTLVIGKTSFRRIEIPSWPLVGVLFVFLVTLALVFSPCPERWKYWLSLAAATLTPILMIGFVAHGLSVVNATGERDEVLSLGFASVYRGRYVADAEPEWLLSLTSRREVERLHSERIEAKDDAPAQLAGGFGVPLWVLFMAVIGAGLTTVAIIVKQIRDRPNFSQIGDVRRRLEMLALHQFFTLFAPLGAVFIYQLLVVAKGASQPVTVALAALGAGLSLTTLLDKAVVKIQEALSARRT